MCVHAIIALDCTHGRMTSGVACSNVPWAAHMVRFFLVWNARMVLRKHAQLDDIDRCMPLSPLGSTLFRMTSGVTFHHHPWEAHTVGRHRQVMPSLLLESIHSRTMSSVASYYRPCIEHTIKCCWAWHACMALRQHTQSDYDGRVMPSLPLGSRHGRMTSGVAWHHRL